MKSILSGVVKALLLTTVWILVGLSHGQTHNAGDDTTNWRLVGQAQLKFMFFNVYQSQLYTSTGGYAQEQRPIRLDIRYQRDLTAKTLLEQTREEWRHLGVAEAEIQQWSDHLAGLWPDVKENDVLTFRINSEGKGTFSYNGTFLGDIENTDLASAFIAIWLSPDTSRPEHRQQLIGSQSL